MKKFLEKAVTVYCVVETFAIVFCFSIDLSQEPWAVAIKEQIDKMILALLLPILFPFSYMMDYLKKRGIKEALKERKGRLLFVLMILQCVGMIIGIVGIILR